MDYVRMHLDVSGKVTVYMKQSYIPDPKKMKVTLSCRAIADEGMISQDIDFSLNLMSFGFADMTTKTESFVGDELIRAGYAAVLDGYSGPFTKEEVKGLPLIPISSRNVDSLFKRELRSAYGMSFLKKMKAYQFYKDVDFDCISCDLSDAIEEALDLSHEECHDKIETVMLVPITEGDYFCFVQYYAAPGSNDDNCDWLALKYSESEGDFCGGFKIKSREVDEHSFRFVKKRYFEFSAVSAVMRVLCHELDEVKGLGKIARVFDEMGRNAIRRGGLFGEDMHWKQLCFNKDMAFSQMVTDIFSCIVAQVQDHAVAYI